MEFGSKFVYDYSDSEEEWVSDDEFEDGMSYGEAMGRVTQTARKEEIPRTDEAASPVESKPKSQGSKGTGARFLKSLTSLPHKVRASFGGSTEQQPERKKKEKKHHWMSRGTGSTTVPYSSGSSLCGKRWRRADTNIVEVSFRQLTAPSNMHTGDPVYCDQCQAVLSTVSEVQHNNGEQVWVCEFCGHHNVVDLMEDEVPGSDVVTYMLQPAPCTTSSGKSGRDESLVIFCIDISGSMCVTSEVPGTIKLRGDRTGTLQDLNTDHSRQRLPSERRDVTYVSRLQGVQAAVDHQLGEMARDYPDRRAAIITFNSEVVIVGDGSGDPIHISGDKLSDRVELIKIGKESGMPNAVRETRTSLGNKIFEFEEGGQTALGPALLVSVAMACQVPGSKVIICTDGMANVGLGSHEQTDNDDNAYDVASVFYTQVGQMAVDKGVSVSVISIKGTSCKLMELGQVAEATQGQVNIVDPLKLTEEFGSILANPVIATNVTSTLLLHKHLYFRQEDSKESCIVRKVGNVTKSTNITFEYGIREEFRKHVLGKMPGTCIENPLYAVEEGKGEAETDDVQGDIPETECGYQATASSATEDRRPEATLTDLPFQLQIEYTDLDGAKALLVRSQTKPITRDRQLAEQDMNVAAVGAHAAQKSAKLALKGNFTPSRLNAFMYQRLVRRHTTETGQEDDYARYYDNVAPIEEFVNVQQQNERAASGCCYSDDEGDDDDKDKDGDGGDVYAYARVELPRGNLHQVKPMSKKSMINRRRECSDEGAELLYGNLKTSSSSFGKK